MVTLAFRRLTARQHDLLAGGVFLLGAFWVMARGWRDPQKTPGHLVSDHYWFQWLLAHAARSVSHWENPFFSQQMNHPDGVNVMANTSMLGIGIPLTPVTLIFGSAVSYLTALTIGMALTAFSAYYVLSRYVVKSRLAAALGGGLFGFAPGFVHHANGQPNFVTHFMLPLIVLFTVKLIVESRPIRDGVILGLMVTYQVFLNEEMLLITAMAAGVIALVLILSRREYGWVNLAKGLSVALAVALPLLAYPLWFQFAGPQSYKSFAYFHQWGEDVSAYVSYSRDTLAGNEWVEGWIGRTEQNTWYGWPLVLLAITAAVLLWRTSLIARITTITGGIFFLLGLGPEIHFRTSATGMPGPWRLLGKLPVLGLLTPSRLTFVVTGAVAIMVALFTERVLELAREHPAVPVKLIGGLAIAAALLPIMPWPLRVQATPPVPDFVTSGHWRNYVDKSHSLVPLPLPAERLGTRALRWSAYTGNEMAIPRGYFIGPHEGGVGAFGAPPTPFSDFMTLAATDGPAPTLTTEVRESAMTDVRHWHATVAILEDDHPRAAIIKSAMDEIFGPAQHVDDVYLWDLRSLN